MGDGKDKPNLQPPPRIPAAGTPDPGAGTNRGRESTSPGRRIGRAAVFVAMAFGLVGVFVLLPRWQEQRPGPFADGGGTHEATSSPGLANPTEPVPVATTDSTILEPSPNPPPTHTPRPPAISPKNTPRPQLSIAERQYVEAMSRGLTALDNRQWQAAFAAFERASKLHPDKPEVADGLARARAGERLEKIADGIQSARDSEQNEEWRTAERVYSAVLTLDPESAAALDGQRRTDVRAALDETIEYHLANPGRLSTPEVFSEAATALEEALDTVPSGPRLESQIARLEILLTHVSTPVAVVLESDDLTEVMVYRVGRLGTFSRRELNLKPGAYTVVGSRHGYRDVRLQLVITPGSPPKPLEVRCTESL